MLPNRTLTQRERDLSDHAFYLEPQRVHDERHITTKHGQVLFSMRCANDKDLVQAAVAFGLDLVGADFSGMDLEGVRWRPAQVPTYSALLAAKPAGKPADKPVQSLKDMPR